jgi:hypothetical protein
VREVRRWEVGEALEVCCEMWEVRDLQGPWKADSVPRGVLQSEILAELKSSSEVEFIQFVM